MVGSGSVWEVVGGKEAGGITVRTGKDLKSPEAPGGRLSHGATVAELELDGERLRFTRLAGEGPNEGWVSLKFKERAIVVRRGEKGSKAAKDAKQLAELKANGGVMQPKEGAYRLLILAQGSRGDVQPLLALAIAARKAGWAIYFLASPENEEFVTSYGFRFTGCGVDVREGVGKTVADFDAKTMAEDEKVKEFQEDQGKAGGEALMEMFSPEVQAEMTNVLMDVLKKTKEEEALPDAIFYHGLTGNGAFLAWHTYGIPIFALDYVMSCVEPEEEILKNFVPNCFETMGPDVLKFHGVDPFDGVDPKEVASWKCHRTLTCSSALSLYGLDFFLAVPDEMKELMKSGFCGPMVMDPVEQMVDLSYFGGQETLRKIQDFLEAGPPPAYLGWGSMPMVYPSLMKALTNCKFIKMRAIVLGGWARFNEEDFIKTVMEIMPEDPFGLVEYARTEVCFVAVAPHEWLFERCAFTVHHGGAGTTQAAFRAGKPTIITPFSFDQFQYAQLCVNLGCGQTLSLMEGNEKMMDPMWTKAFRKATSDKAMLEKAKEVAAAIRKENGCQEVLARIKKGIEEKASGETKGRFGC